MSRYLEFEGRRAEYPIDTLFLRRWSPRAMSGDALAPHKFFTILEAARWAPSAHNAQPWRFLYALRDDALWPTFLSLLNASHRRWIAKAGALLIIVAKTTSDYDDHSPTFSFDAGGACQNACLQATSLGLVSHVVQVHDKNAVRRSLQVPDEYAIEFGLVLGRPGQRSELPPELQARESPRQRRPLSEIVFEGQFPVPESEHANGDPAHQTRS